MRMTRNHQLRRALSLCLVCLLVLTSGSLARPQTQDPLADSGNTQQLVGAFVTVLGMAAEPEGPIVLAAAQGLQQMMGMLGFFDKPDAIQALSQRIDELNARVDRLEIRLDALHDDSLRGANLQKLKDLHDLSDKLAHVLLFLKNKRALSEAEDNALSAQQVCDKLKDFPDYWEWSDEAIKDIDPKNANTSNNELVNNRNADLINRYLQRWNHGKPIRKGEMMDADFKPLPTLQIYTAGLIAWMAALDYASNGDTSWVKNNYGAKLQAHIDFLSVRPKWNKFAGQQPRTLPEKVLSHIRSLYVTLRPTPDSNRECDLVEYVDDGFARDVRHVGKNITYTARTSNEMCGPGKLVTYESGEEQKLEASYGLGVMETLAKQLTHLRDHGTIRTQYIGTFTPSSTQSEVLYKVRRDGSLWWQEDVIGLLLSTADLAQGDRTTKITTTLVSHTLGDAKHIGDGWDSPQDILPGGGSTIYVLRKNGNLDWWLHNGYQKGEVNWVGPITVGTGWNSFKQIIPMGNGVLYGILPDGTLRWNKHNNYKTGQGGYGGWAQPAIDVGRGWNFKTVFGGGNGVFYAVTEDGKLLWYRHKAYLEPVAMPPPGNSMVSYAQRLQWANTWEGPKEIGTGWNGFTKLFSNGLGNIYGILPSGEMRVYRHLGFQDGSPRWGYEPAKLPGRWMDYLFVFSTMPSSAPQDDIIVK